MTRCVERNTMNKFDKIRLRVDLVEAAQEEVLSTARNKLTWYAEDYLDDTYDRNEDPGRNDPTDTYLKQHLNEDGLWLYQYAQALASKIEELL